MKNTILILISLLVFTGCEEGKVVTSLEDRNGIKYEVDSKVGFTGKYVQRDEDGQKEYETNFKEGKLEGLETFWYYSGQKSREGNYKDGKREGLWTWWHDNGQKRSEINYVDGKREGLRTGWHEDGQKKLEINYVDGKREGLRTYGDAYENGQKVVTSLEDRGGIKYEVNSEVGYTGKYTEWHDNGQKWYEMNYKDGKEEGLFTMWYPWNNPDGQKSREGNYKDGKREGLWTWWYERGQKEAEENYKDGELDGLWTSWYYNGETREKRNYKDGKLVMKAEQGDADAQYSTEKSNYYEFSKLERDDDPILYKKANEFLSTVYRNGNLENGCYKITRNMWAPENNYCVGIADVTKSNDLIYMVTSGPGYDAQWEPLGCHSCAGAIKYSILKESGDTFEIYAESAFEEAGKWGSPPSVQAIELNKKGDLAWFYDWSYTSMGYGTTGMVITGLVNGEVTTIADIFTGYSVSQCSFFSVEEGGCTTVSRDVSASVIHKGDADFYPLYLVENTKRISNGVETKETKSFLVEYSKDKESYVFPTQFLDDYQGRTPQDF